MSIKPFVSLRALRAKMNGPEERGWTRRESVVALISVVVAAIGAVASAGSAFFTYEQVRMLNRERLTPYRTILYSVKLASYRELVTTFYEFDRHFPIHEPVASLLKANDGKVQYFARHNKAQFESFEIELNKLRASIEANRVNWPEAMSTRLDSILGVVSEAEDCYGTLSHIWSLPDPRSDSQYLSPDCADVSIMNKGTKFRGAVTELKAAMRADLRTDQLQAVDSDK